MENYRGDANSIVNQDIKSRFVSIHVHACVTSMVEYILKQQDRDAPFDMDDVDNLYSYPEWSKTVVGDHLYFDGGSDEDYEAFKDEFQRLKDESQDLLDKEEISEVTHERNVSLIEDAEQEFERLDTEAQEVYEWWLVSEFLCRKLKELGHPVLDSEQIWGRCGSGQAILLDYSISVICADMGILDGQPHSWANNKA